MKLIMISALLQCLTYIFKKGVQIMENINCRILLQRMYTILKQINGIHCLEP